MLRVPPIDKADDVGHAVKFALDDIIQQILIFVSMNAFYGEMLSSDKRDNHFPITSRKSSWNN